MKALWIVCAQRRLIDQRRCAESARRDPVAVGDHAQALAVSVSGDVTQLTEDARQWWRIREVLSTLSGDQRAVGGGVV